VANKQLTGYGTWKSAEAQENKELVFPALREEKRKNVCVPPTSLNDARISKETIYRVYDSQVVYSKGYVFGCLGTA
jgi:hypothetical protein